MQCLVCYLTGILTLALWLPATGSAAFIPFAALYGFASGGYISLIPAQIAYVSKVEQIGLRTGMHFAVVAFAGLIGNPVAGAIVNRDHGGFNGLQIFSGVTLLAGATSFLVARIVTGGFTLKRI